MVIQFNGITYSLWYLINIKIIKTFLTTSNIQLTNQWCHTPKKKKIKK